MLGYINQQAYKRNIAGKLITFFEVEGVIQK